MLNVENPLYQQDLEQISNWIKFDQSEISVLVTGASGLIGSLAVDAMLYFNNTNRKKIHVYALSRNIDKLKERFSQNLNNEHLTLISQDITQPLDNEHDYDYVIHAASNADPRTYALYPVQTIQTNVLGASQVLEYARRHPSVRVLLTSTMEVYGSTPEGTISQEDQYGLIDFNMVRSGYPESKRVSELLFRSYATQYGTDSVIARLGYIYGPSMTREDNKVIAQFIRMALAGDKIILKSQGTQRRSYCYAADAVAGLFCILFFGETGAAYNVSNRESNITIREMAIEAATQTGTEVIFDFPNETESRGFSEERDAVLDESKLRLLGWTPQYPFAKGFARTVSILRDDI